MDIFKTWMEVRCYMDLYEMQIYVHLSHDIQFGWRGHVNIGAWIEMRP